MRNEYAFLESCFRIADIKTALCKTKEFRDVLASQSASIVIIQRKTKITEYGRTNKLTTNPRLLGVGLFLMMGTIRTVRPPKFLL